MSSSFSYLFFFSYRGLNYPEPYAERRKRERDNFKRTCHICNDGHVFNARGTYNNHMKKHEGRYDFECHLCSKKFVCKGNLTAHMITHSETKSQVCPWCDQGFKLKSNMKRHILTVHRVVFQSYKICMGTTIRCLDISLKFSYLFCITELKLVYSKV